MNEYSDLVFELLDALSEGDVDDVKNVISKGVDIHEIKDGDNVNYLHRVLIFYAKTVKTEVIQFLIEQGLDVNLRDFYGATPLHYATKHRRHDAVELLLKAGAEPDVLDRQYRTPLRYCIQRNAIYDSIKMLLDYGADPDNIPKEGYASIREVFLSGDTSHDPRIRELLLQG